MPIPGEKAHWHCTECGRVRHWLDIGAPRSATAGPAPFAYCCDKGHISDACPHCCGRETSLYRAEDRSLRGILVCHGCGSISTLTRVERAVPQTFAVRPVKPTDYRVDAQGPAAQ
jgi:hypothetical protein